MIFCPESFLFVIFFTRDSTIHNSFLGLQKIITTMLFFVTKNCSKKTIDKVLILLKMYTQ